MRTYGREHLEVTEKRRKLQSEYSSCVIVTVVKQKCDTREFSANGGNEIYKQNVALTALRNNLVDVGVGCNTKKTTITIMTMMMMMMMMMIIIIIIINGS
jgi:hypothetical protein